MGVELADIGEAVKEAMRRAAEIARREASNGAALNPGWSSSRKVGGPSLSCQLRTCSHLVNPGNFPR